jgi:hypothetical protein
MRKIGLTLAGAIGVWAGAGVVHAAAVSPVPARDAAISVSSAFDTQTLFITWADGVDPAVRDLALVLGNAAIVAESSDGLTSQVRAADMEAAQATIAGFGPGVVAAVQPASEFISAKFGLSGFEIANLNLDPHRAADIQIPVVLDGREELLVLEQHSLRSPDFKLLVDVGGGVLVEQTPPPVETYQGVLDGVEGSVVSASLHNGLTAVVRIDGPFPRDFVVQPLSEAFDAAPAGAHVVYSARNVVDQHAQCGGAILHPDMGDALKGAVEAPATSGSSRVRKVCQIAFDADFEFYQLNGSSVPNTTADIENVLNSVRITYERDCDVTFTITTVIVRSNSSDPYTTSDSSALLTQFRTYWQANHGSVTRDIAHLMTGRNVDGSVIGIAWLSAVCTSNGYGLSQSRFTSNFNQRFSLTAHEVGHNFSADHCDGNGDCHIMCSGLGGCNGLGSPPFFGVAEKTGINSYAQGRPCLSNATNNAPVLSVIDPDNGDTYNQGNPVQFIGAATDDQDDTTALSNTITWTSNLQGLLGTGPSVVRSDLVVGTHTVTASVTDSGGLSDTEVRTFSVNSTVTIPAVPSGQLTIESPAGNALHTWVDNATNETSFSVQRQQRVGTAWTGTTTFTGIAANSSSYNSAAGQGVWRYRVRANNSAGSSAYTAWATALPLGPSGGSASQSGGTVTYAWTDNALFEENFDVQRQQRVGTTWTNTTTFVLGANATSYVEAPGSGQWRYRVRSKAPGRFSAYTTWSSVTVP